jgi:hypothetical protein
MSFGARNAILVGKLSPLKIVSTLRLGSLIVGIAVGGRDTSKASLYKEL